MRWKSLPQIQYIESFLGNLSVKGFWKRINSSAKKHDQKSKGLLFLKRGVYLIKSNCGWYFRVIYRIVRLLTYFAKGFLFQSLLAGDAVSDAADRRFSLSPRQQSGDATVDLLETLPAGKCCVCICVFLCEHRPTTLVLFCFPTLDVCCSVKFSTLCLEKRISNIFNANIIRFNIFRQNWEMLLRKSVVKRSSHLTQLVLLKQENTEIAFVLQTLYVTLSSWNYCLLTQ